MVCGREIGTGSHWIPAFARMTIGDPGREILIKKPIPLPHHQFAVLARRQLPGHLTGGVSIHHKHAIVGEDAARLGARELAGVEGAVAATAHDDEFVNRERFRARRW